MVNIIAIFIGGGIGAVLRYISNLAAIKYIHLDFPVSTLFVNILGGFIIGLLSVLFMDKIQINESLKLALTVGFCGGLTTFSTFSLEIFKMITQYELLYALFYAIASIILCLIAVVAGIYIAKL